MSDPEDEFAPLISFLGWELWPWTDNLRWMLTHDRLMICEWRRRGGLFVYRRNLMAWLGIRRAW